MAFEIRVLGLFASWCAGEIAIHAEHPENAGLGVKGPYFAR